MVEGHIYTEGRITKDYPQQMKAQIASLPLDVTHIIHHIQSPGGDCYAAFNGYHEIMKIGKPIKSIIEGEAQSMATFLAIAPANEVQILNPSTFMIHEPFFPEGVAGTVDELQSAKDELEQIRTAMALAYAKKTNKPLDEIYAMMKKTTRLDAHMAKSMGFVDVVNEPRRIAAIGELIDEIKEFKNEIMGLFTKRAVAVAPTAMDLPTKDGKMLMIQSEDGEFVGKPAMIDGVPAEGTYDLQDGRQIVIVGGVVTEVKTAAAPEETEAMKLQKQLEATQAQLNQIKAAEQAKINAAEEAAKIAAEQAKMAELAKALEESQKTLAEQAAKIEALEKKPLGDQSKPSEGMSTQRSPFGAGVTSDEKLSIMATRTFMADEHPEYESAYPGGKYKDGTTFNSYRTGSPNAVSILETNLSYTWNGVLSLDLFMKPTLNSPAMSDFATIDIGAKDSKRYHFLPTFNKILRPYTGCDQAVTGTSADITDKRIQLKPFQMYEGWCKDDFTNQLTGGFNVFAQEWLKTGNESFDPAGTPIDRYIVAGLKDALRIDTFRRIMFADTGSSDVDYNQINGYWSNLIDQAGASNYCVYRYGSALGTGVLSAGTANTYLQGVYEGSNLLLRQEGIATGRAKFYVTQSVWDNYFTYLVGVGAVTEQAYTTYLKGSNNLTYRGIPVIPVPLWDSLLTESDNPLFATTRHLISLSIKENHVIGVENTADLGKIDSWFEKKDNKRYYRSNMTMGFLGALHCDLTSIAY